MRDLVVHGDDIVVGTHGRSFWILDDITPLRQITAEVAGSDAFLFRPQLTYRMRRSTNTDTPFPPGSPRGKIPRRRHSRLLPQGESRQPGAAGDFRFRGQTGAPLLQC